MRKILFLILSTIILNMSYSQGQENYVKRGTLAVQAGGYDFLTAQRIRNSSLSNVLSKKDWATFKDINLALGLSYIKGLNSHIDYSVNGFFGSTRYPVRSSTGSVTVGDDKLLTEIDASIHLKMLSDKYAVVPYLSGGLGGSLYDKRFEAFSLLGGGLQVKLAPDHFVFSNFQYRIPVTQGGNYHFMYTIGIGAPVGKPKEVEQPKAVPVAPVAVPEPPRDSDGDGIVDPDDSCPAVPGVAKYKGCPVPDTDKDGINDDTDQCPTVPGVAKYQGCPVPDTDKDGINDDEDKCPTQAGLAKYQGCPIPDTDGDGINDEEDKCPTAAGIPQLFGCPRPDFKAENVLFGTGSAILLASGKKELDIIVDYLKQFDGFKVNVEGHTDNTGNPQINQILSEKRAISAKNYLVSKGIDGIRLSTAGFGQSKPIADNKTAEGRKKNRRVQFSIVE